MFAFRTSVEGDLGNIEVAFTDSSADFGDTQGALARAANGQSLAKACGARPQVMHQVHGTRVHWVGDPNGPEGPRADALVTNQPGVALVVRVADCVPVLLADPQARLIAAAHAGRVGLHEGVIAATLAEMGEHGATEIQAWVGPHICGLCYEVPHEMRALVAAAIPETFANTSWGTPSLDIGAGVMAQLSAAGCVVTEVPGCSYEDPRWHSFRRDGDAAGRMAGLVWMT